MGICKQAWQSDRMVIIAKKNTLVLLALAIVLTFSLTACQETYIENKHKEEINIKIGQSQKMVLESIPEGLSESAYEWSTGIPRVASVDTNGNVTALEEGMSSIRATAKIGNKVYSEAFLVVVPIEQGKINGISLKVNGKNRVPEIPMLEGEYLALNAILDADNPVLLEGEEYTWELSNSDVASIDFRYITDDKSTACIVAQSVGEVDVIAKYKDIVSDVAHIRVYDNANSFSYLMADAAFIAPAPLDGAVRFNRDVADTLPLGINLLTYEIGLQSPTPLENFASNPKGKYAVITTFDFENSNGFEGTINETSVVDFSATAMLPLELIPNSPEEIEYILAIDVCAKQVGTYDKGTKAMQLYWSATIKNAVTGKIVEVIREEVYGEAPPNYIHFPENEKPPERSFGYYDGREKVAAVQDMLHYVWEKEKSLNLKFGLE